MQTVNMFQAKTSLSKLVAAVESGQEKEIIISRHGVSVARLTSTTRQPTQQRIGVAKDCFVVPDNIDEPNDLILKMFSGESP